MKATGIVRKVDELGRFVIPIEIRRNFLINDNVSMEIFITEDSIVLKKYEASCILCGTLNQVKTFKGKRVCIKCVTEIMTNI